MVLAVKPEFDMAALNYSCYAIFAATKGFCPIWHCLDAAMLLEMRKNEYEVNTGNVMSQQEFQS